MSFIKVLPRTISRFFENTGSDEANTEFADAGNNEMELVRKDTVERLIDNEVPKKEKRQELSDQGNVEQLTITTCGSISEILELLHSSSIEASLKNTQIVTVITFKTVTFETSLSSNELDLLAIKCIEKSIIILIASKNDDKFLIYWKSSDIDNFLSLKSYSIEMESNKTIFLFIVDFLTYSLNQKHLGLCKSLCTNCESKEFELHFLADNREYNVLLVAAELGHYDVVSNLLKMGFETDSPFKFINAQSLACENRHFDVLFLLLKSNLRYPVLMDVNECSEDIRSFINISDSLHQHIKSNNMSAVKDIVAENSNLRYFYNTSNESAASIALKCKNIEIYEFLMTNEVYFGPHENTEIIMEDLDYDTQRIVRELHFKHSKDLPENHINVLMANSFIGHDVSNAQEKLSLVQHAFTTLNRNGLIRIILMVVAASMKFRIIFDFNRDNVHVVDPTSSAYANGIFYVSGRIYIGARQLLDKMTENETLGTLAHELCHYALNLTYRNDAKPYGKNDHQLMQKFDDICKKCEKNREIEEIVNLVYECYPEDMHHAELAVRVAHMIALYHEKPDKLQESREVYNELFDYVEQHVRPEMEEEIPRIMKQFDREIEEKNRKISNLRRNLFISICIGLFAVIGVAAIAMVNHNPIYNFSELSPEDQYKVRNTIVSYKNINVKMSDLYPKNSNAYSKLTSDHIAKLLKGKVLNLDDLKYIHEDIHFEWENLAKPIQTVVYNSNLRYQGETIKYKDLDESVPQALSAISSSQIRDVLNKQELIVGEKIDSSVDFYIKRKFYPEETNLIDYEHRYGHDYQYDILTYEEHVENRIKDISTEQFFTNFKKQTLEEQSAILDKIRKNVNLSLKVINVNDPKYKFLLRNSSQIIEQAEYEKILILSSEAGAGKTVTFEQLAIEIKSIFPTRWVSYIDLKDHTQYYNKDGNMTNVEELLEHVLNVNSVKNNFEHLVFKESFVNNKSVLFWNGFDEISPTYNSFILNTIKSIYKATSNIQFVCTRPLYSGQLRDTFEIQTWDLVPLDDNGKQEFFTKYFKSQNMSSENIAKNIEKAKETIDKFESVSNLAYNFSTPVMLKLVSEIYDSHGSNETPGLYEIYETFVQKKIGIWLTKSKLEKKILQKFISKFSVIEIYQKYALLNELRIFGTTTFSLKFKKLKIMQSRIPKDLPYEEISRMGILYINGENKFEFAHRTFAEFFIAKYFIENLYLVDNYVDKGEIELRLELFFLMARNYKYNQEVVTNFMESYFEIINRDEDEHFCDKLKELIRDKFKNAFIRLLDTNYPKIYNFLFKFFGRDHEVLLNLLRIDEHETFFTAIFDPNYFAIFTNPNEINDLARQYLTNVELDKFTHGKYQKGKILYGMHFYEHIGVNKSHSSYNSELKSLNISNFWDFHEKVNETLTINEQKELAITALSPKIYLFYNETFSDFDYEEYETLWTIHENWLTGVDIQHVLENAFINYFELFTRGMEYFYILTDKLESLSEHQIFEVFKNSNMLQKAHWNSNEFDYLWNILAGNATEPQLREILLQNFTDDRNFYFYKAIKELKNQFSNNTYVYLYYDFTKFTILHRALTAPYYLTFNNVREIYYSLFNITEIQDMIISSNDLLYYIVEESLEESCEIFAIYLKELFNENPNVLKKLLEKKIRPTNLNIFSMIESFNNLAGSEVKWSKKVNILRKVYDELN
ncbi:uncharacterized protein [Chironomus tepperi]|uniref:uncharacterized protein n=1 Tax=Chironomus tepperi TaxID=113505 RepID=UPI00391F5421